jgi:hypothetical protein
MNYNCQSVLVMDGFGTFNAIELFGSPSGIELAVSHDQVVGSSTPFISWSWPSEPWSW